VRNSPVNPVFEIAFIGNNQDVPVQGGGGQGNQVTSVTTLDGFVHHMHISFSTGGTPTVSDEALPQIQFIPDGTSTGHTQGAIAKPLRVKIMVASCRNVTPTPTAIPHVIGYYVIDQESTGNELLFFKETEGAFTQDEFGVHHGWYVDGPNSALPPPSPAIGPDQGIDMNNRLIALANPYDGEPNGNYDEFHCLYQIVTTTNSPLLIVRGANNGKFGFATDTRTVINYGNGQWATDPQEYCMAANQAGIHIWWEGGSSEFYSRDNRAYDEQIDEPTIMTYSSMIGDGTAHLGTIGATLQPSTTLLVWTDPAWATTSRNTLNAQISMSGAGVGLSIGTTTIAPASKAIFFPSFSCTFASQTNVADREFIVLNPNSICNYYGKQPGWAYPNFIGDGDFILTGVGYAPQTTHSPYYYPDLTNQAAANLRIEAGWQFVLPGCSRLLTSASNVIFLHETDQFGAMDGTAKISIGNLENSVITCSATDPTAKILTITAPLCGELYSDVTNCLVRNDQSSTGNTALISIEDPMALGTYYDGSGNASYFAVLIQGGKFDGVGIHTSYASHTSDQPFVPMRPLSVVGTTFDHIPAQAIHLTRSTSASASIADYYVSITGNWFEHFLSPSSSVGSDGILLEDFTVPVPDLDLYSPYIKIAGNTFSTATSFTGNDRANAAIHLTNSSAVVDNNTISAAGTYTYGIEANGDIHSSTYTVLTNSLFCSNSISNMGYYDAVNQVEVGGGISTEYWSGYEKNNEIWNCAQGSILGAHDEHPKLIFANYHSNDGAGINNTTNDNVYFIEMRGVIHDNDHSIDVAGNNKISGNNLRNIAGEVVIANNSVIRIGNEDHSWTASINYGMNSFVGNNTSTDWLFYTPYIPGANSVAYIGYGTSTAPDHALDKNYYEINGTALIPANNNQLNGIADPRFHDIFYSTCSTSGCHPTVLTSRTTSSVDCYGGGLKPNGKKGENTPLAADTLDLRSCVNLGDKTVNLFDAQHYQACYDSAKAYLTLCFDQRHSEAMFGEVSGANDFRNNNPLRYDTCREWLASVLYLRADSLWYCSDVSAILYSFKYVNGTFSDTNTFGYKGPISVLRYVMGHRKCDTSWFKDWLAPGDSAWSYKLWKDTTVPPIDAYGLSVLRGPQASVRPVGLSSNEDHLSGLYVTENPFTNNSEVKFTLYDYGLVTFQLFDALGKEQTSNGIGQVLEPGEHSFEIDGIKLASGVYFARLSYHNGDVKTVLVRKK
jgi:hypothetical protein